MAVLTCSYYSLARKGFVSFTAILPVEPLPVPDAPREYAGGAFPTIYLLHGYSGNRNDWLLRTRIEEWATAEGWAVIMPDGANSFYLDNEATGELYGTFVGEELVEITRKMFNLSSKKEDTVIAGLSMGGFGALRNGLFYPNRFGAVVALSSALITDEVAQMKEGEHNGVAPYSYYRHIFGDTNKVRGSDKDPKYLAKACLENGVTPRVFLACGSEDFLYENNCDYHNYLEEIGYKHAWRITPGVHNFDFWNTAMQAALKWVKDKGE